MFRQIKKRMRSFRDDTTGSVAIEAVIITPVLFTAFLSVIVFFDMYQKNASAEKAAFTISDMLSRETTAVNQDYLDSALDLFTELASSDHPSSLRVSVLTYTKRGNKYRLDWSKSSGGATVLKSGDLAEFTPNVPVLVPGERLIVVETFSTFDPAFNVGLGSQEVSTLVFTRPRFAPKLAWSNT